MFKVNNKKPFSNASIVAFEHVNVSLVHSHLTFSTRCENALCDMPTLDVVRWVKYAQSYHLRHQNESATVYYVFNVGFEQVRVC